MGATSGFDTYYGDTPVQNLDKNQRKWYHPIVDTMFRQHSIFNRLVRYYYNLGNVNATSMEITQLMDPHANFDPLGMRDIWMPASYVDSRAVRIGFSRYGGKVAYHEYDDMITYWKDNQGGGVRNILQGALGQHMIDVHDYVLRNKFLNLPFQYYVGGGSDFSDLTASDVMTWQLAQEMWLGFSYRDVPMASDPSLPMRNNGSILCLTSPGVIYDIQQGTTDNEDWIPVVKYADPSRALRYEVGTAKNTRYLASPRMTLWNCGNITQQLDVTAAITAGDGAPDPSSTQVDSTYYVGQTSTGRSDIKHYIQLESADLSGISVGQIITIHSDKTDEYGVTDGADFNDGTMHVRRVVAVNDTDNRLTLDRPIMIDFSTELESGVYAYVTIGGHVHASLFMAGPDAVVMGVGRAPVMKAPPPVDDFAQVFRFSWNGYEGANFYRPEVAEIAFSAGSTRVVGARSINYPTSGS